MYSLFTNDCVAMPASNSIIKFADDTTVLGLITNNDETAYREEVRALRVVEKVERFKFLGVHITDKLKCTPTQTVW